MVLYSNALTSRLKLLVKNMSKIKDGKFDVFVSSDKDDEIGDLSRSFKSMVNRINNLINEVYLLEIKKKEAEINALQSQINPHFLFNTMESIRMNLWKKDDFETSEIVQKFAQLLRKSIDWASDGIELKKEIELVATYLDIQKYRYREKLEYVIQIDDELNNYIIPKFTLQPIVENAIYHGIEMKKGKGRVTISSQVSEQGLKVIVKDDGIGMDEDKLSTVRKQISSPMEEDRKTRIGIRNVHQRLKLYYGETYGVSIYSNKNTGTVVEILLPL
jgi:two-component system sensor histidine kinase YesM